MLAKLYTFSRLGIEAVPVDVEVDASSAALPKTILDGLPEAAVKERRIASNESWSIRDSSARRIAS